MAVKDLFKGGSTQTKLDDVQKRLRDINGELDALNLTSVPTSDLVIEEEQALRRLARKEALGRVSSALSAEQAELQATLAQEKAEEKRAKVAKTQADMDKAKAVLIDKVWAAYESSEAFKTACGDLDDLVPDFQTRSSHADSILSRLLNILEDMRVVKVSIDIMHNRTLTRIKA